MKSIFKKLMALTLSLAMIGSSVALAADANTGEIEGSGSMEGFVGADEEIFSAELPTITEFEFVMDPQGLIAASTQNGTVAGAHGDTKFEGTTGLFFKNEDGNYTAFSDVMTITNMGNIDIEVTLTAALVATDMDVYETTEDFVEDEPDTLDENEGEAAIYMAIETGKLDENGFVAGTFDEDGVFETDTAAAATVALPAEAADAEVYTAEVVDAKAHTEAPEYKWEEGKGYYSKYPDNDVVTYSSLHFRVTGAVNKLADWTESKNAEAKLTMTWTIDPVSDADEEPEFENYVEKFTVTFNMNGRGEQVAERQVNKGTPTSAPSVANTDGYQVTGWYTNSKCTGAAFDFTTAITEDITLYAKWEWVTLSGDIVTTVGSTSSKSVTITVPADQTVTSVTLNGTAITGYSVSGNTLTLTGTYLKSLAAGTYTYTVTFSNNDTATFTLAVNAQ